jgi:hypothetical protein
LPKWSPELAIGFMDAHEIATGIVSLSSPSVVGWRGNERRQMTRRVNEYTADLVTNRPATLDANESLGPDEREAVNDRNALALFPRLMAQA